MTPNFKGDYMETMQTIEDIKNAELWLYSRDDPMQAGAIDVFNITLQDDSQLQVPINVENRHYWVVKEWYELQNDKPFNFNFEKLPEPGTILPVQDADDLLEVQLAVSADQTQDANLPEINLTPDQYKELAGE